MRLLLTFLISTVLYNPASSQGILNPVHWKFSAEHVGVEEYDLFFDAKMDQGWTLYSQHLDDGGPIPTEFTFEDGQHFARVDEVKESENAKTVHDKIFDMKLIKFFDKARFTQRVKVTDASKPITGYLTFMTCDDEKCLPPTDVDFVFKLPAPAGGKSDAEDKSKGADNVAEGDDDVPEEAATADTDSDEIPESKVASNTVSNDIQELTVDLGKNDEGILEPVKWSFHYEVTSDDTYDLVATASIDKGWQIYSQRSDPDALGPTPTTFYFEENPELELVGEPTESSVKRVEEYDKFFDMDLVKFKEVAEFRQTVRTTTKPVINGEVEYMTCNDEKCIPAYEVFAFDLSKKAGVTVSPAEENEPEQTAVSIDGGVIDQSIPSILTTHKDPIGDCDDNGEESTEGKSLLWTFVLGFLGGLLALLTPCVFPMIPLTVSYFSKDTKRKGWVNGAFYGASIIVIYVTIGLLITAFFGATALNELSTNWIANTLFFLIFCAFALSFFGYYEITLPSSWTNKSDRMADRGGWIGIFFMAFTLALVSFSCTGPIIGSALVESATNKSGPFVVMLGFSTALALPFGLFAAFPAWLNTLPRSGSWMNSVKVILGFLELALAFKFLSVADMTSHWNFLKYEFFLGVWVLIAAAMAAYLFGWIRFPHDSPMKKLSVSRLSLAVGMAALTAYLATGFLPDQRTGTYNSLAMLSGLAPPAHYNFFKPPPEPDQEIQARFPSYSKCANNLDCFHDYYEGMEYAREVNKPVFVDFTGYGCVNCRKTEEHIWVNDKVWKRLKNDFVMISLYVDDKKPLEPVLVSKRGQKRLRNVGLKWADFQIVNFGQNTQPLYVIMTPEGEVLTTPRGYREGVEGYVDFLECGLSAYERTSSLIGTKDGIETSRDN